MNSGMSQHFKTLLIIRVKIWNHLWLTSSKQITNRGSLKKENTRDVQTHYVYRKCELVFIDYHLPLLATKIVWKQKYVGFFKENEVINLFFTFRYNIPLKWRRNGASFHSLVYDSLQSFLPMSTKLKGPINEIKLHCYQQL